MDSNGTLWTETAQKDLSYCKADTWYRFDTPSSVKVLTPTATHTDDSGRAWFGFQNGALLYLQNPVSVSSISPPPPAAITAIIAGGRRFFRRNNPVLPPLTRRLEINFAGLNLSDPERVRCRYQLEGRDKGWQYAGISRTASYTNLWPGTYHFRLDARNVRGGRNPQETEMLFRIAPAWLQTIWFRALVAILALLIVWTLYRLGLRQVAKAMSVRFDDRRAERTRVAREFHDTLLQTIQGSKLVADSALKQPADPGRMHTAMEQLSGWLGQATEEGLKALNSLRTSTTQTKDLAEAFRRSIDECKIQNVMQATFSVAGEVSEMHPTMRDEVFRIRV